MQLGWMMLVMVLLAVGSGACQRAFHCVAEGTLVATPTGTAAIETLDAGDAVLAQLEDGAVVPARVTATASAQVDSVVRIVLEDATVLRVTATHPVALEAGGFVKAGTLAAGTRVVTRAGGQSVRSVSRERGKANVFDLAVAPGATFFASGVLVHNKTVAAPRPLPAMAGAWVHVGWPDYRLDIQADGEFLLTTWDPDAQWAGRFQGKGWRALGSVDAAAAELREDVVYPTRVAGLAAPQIVTLRVRMHGRVLEGTLEGARPTPRRELVRFVQVKAVEEVASRAAAPTTK
ncbi:MAG TPA: Hint domain-containing protein [Phycisphaerales bacterium]|nr:Hint domain-containing protein [Phycisphaerales bacterium]